MDLGNLSQVSMLCLNDSHDACGGTVPGASDVQCACPCHRRPAGMRDVAAHGVTLTVVAAKVPGEFILRGIKKWTTPEALRSMMEPYVAIIAPDKIGWTFHNYHLPHYIVYGNGDIPRHDLYIDGIYLFKWGPHDVHGPAQRLKGL